MNQYDDAWKEMLEGALEDYQSGKEKEEEEKVQHPIQEYAEKLLKIVEDIMEIALNIDSEYLGRLQNIKERLACVHYDSVKH
uniref:NTP pyrophosphohydrolase MazG putative catalytic core domain-containing protein n=1 Tax=Panagrolaimus sp. ES5 TaxID=591445 RepID=A0AC34FY19_9BILA